MISSPQPSVVHLVTLFRQITNGDIRIPAFQREFVWKEKQMLELLESVAAGFPIGSILLWGVDAKMLKIAPSDATSFPSVEERFPTNYVLDGMQRLSTLYGVFNFGISTDRPIFDVSYDLDDCKFFHTSEGDLFSDRSIPLAALFTPRQLLDHQARLSAMDGGDTLIDRLINLQASFQDYMVPVVTIRSTDIHRIVGIFEKINSTGTKLDPVDFMRAITWAEDFDLNHHLEDAGEILAEIGFDLESETLIKCVGLVLGIPPTTIGLLDLRNRAPDELRFGFEGAIDGLHRVAEFAAERLWVHSADCIPYEGQLLLLFKAVGMNEAGEEDLERIVRWYWSVGFNESLRGKPDHYVVRAVENWRGLVRGSVRGLEPRLRLTEIELFERRIVSGGALSTTFKAMHAASGARDLFSAELIQPTGFMDSTDLGWFDTVFERSELVAAGLKDTISARLFGNVVLVDRSKATPRGKTTRQAILDAANREDWALLETQFIDSEAVDALREGDAQGFLLSRVNIMRSAAERLVGTASADQEVLSLS